MSRCLVVLDPDPKAAWCELDALASAAATGRLIAVLGTGDQRAIYDPTLLQWRLRDRPDELVVPLSFDRESVDPQQIARHRFDQAILLSPNRRDIGLVRKAKIRETWGYGGGLSGFLLSQSIRRPTSVARRAADARDLIEAYGASWQEGDLHRPETWLGVGKERLEKARIHPYEHSTIGIYAGHRGGGSGADPWPADSFEQLMRELRRHDPNRQLVILAGDAELWLSVLLYERTGKIHPVIGPDLTHDGLASVMSCLDLLVSSDSALLRLAGLVGTPTVGLFQRQAARFAPHGRDQRHLERKPLKKLGVDEVLAVCEQALTDRRRRAEREAELEKEAD